MSPARPMILPCARWPNGPCITPKLPEAEGQFSELTPTRADLTAKRNQLEANVRTHRDKLARLDQEITNVAAEEQKLADETGGFGDLDELTATVENAEQTLAASEAAAQAS